MTEQKIPTAPQALPLPDPMRVSGGVGVSGVWEITGNRTGNRAFVPIKRG